MTLTLRDEIIDILKDVYYNNDGGDPFDENDADRILSIFKKRIDSLIKDWQESFEHHQQKEEEWKQKENWEFMDIHHSMKVYSNGAASALELFKDEMLKKK